MRFFISSFVRCFFPLCSTKLIGCLFLPAILFRLLFRLFCFFMHKNSQPIAMTAITIDYPSYFSLSRMLLNQRFYPSKKLSKREFCLKKRARSFV
ncbi:hypothetical protein BN1423_690038 [Carnobacterium maltaromaticum]|nr:hypothetical protein BN1423_690038 [Carnobacterium maltaromaticum]